MKNYLRNYLDVKLVFAMDVALSTFSTLIVLLLYFYILSEAPHGFSLLAIACASSFVWSIVAFLTTRTYRIIIRHTTLRDLSMFVTASGLKSVLMFLTLMAFNINSKYMFICIGGDFAATIVILVLVRVIMIMVYNELILKKKGKTHSQRVLVYGINDKSAAMLTRLANSPHYNICGFIEDKSEKATTYNIAGLPVFNCDNEEEFKRIIENRHVEGILFSSKSDLISENHKLVEFALRNSTRVLVTPNIDTVVEGEYLKNEIREYQIEDLLSRDEIKVSIDEIEKMVKGKTVMVTGAAGSIGSELVRQLAKLEVKALLMFDNAETPLHNIRLEIERKYPELHLIPMIGDVRQLPRLDYAFRRCHPQIVFHAAAYKHVPLMEENPCEGVLVNVVGSKNVADKCVEYGAEKMVMVSTDKAVNPTNIMGCTKRLAEIYVQSLGLAIENGEIKSDTKFITTRFGNVLGSNGSVIPLFKKQIASGGPVTVTDERITRYFMTIPEACRLVLEAGTFQMSNKIFVFDMGNPVKIDDLAKKMIQLSGFVPGKDIKIEYTGLRPGEKLYEEVLANNENTEPTENSRIRIAQVRSYSYKEAREAAIELEALAREVNIDEMVRLMKRTVPEFISQNSEFSKFDKKD